MNKKKIQDLTQRYLNGEASHATTLAAALKADPNNGELHLSMGCIALSKGRTEKAIEHLKSAHRLGVDGKITVIKNLIVAYAMQGEFDRFVNLWDQIKSKTRLKKNELLKLLRSCIDSARLGNHTNIMRYASELSIEIDPDDLYTALGLIDLEIAEGELFKARDAFNKIAINEINDIDVAVRCVEIARRLSHDAQASVFKRAIEIGTDDITVKQRLLGAGLNSKILEPSRKLFEDIVTKNPELLPGMSYTGLNLSVQLMDWDKVEEYSSIYLKAVKNGAITPEGMFRNMNINGLTDEDHKQLATYYHSKREWPTNRSLPWNCVKDLKRKIRIGFFSADFKDHPVSQLLVRTLELIDREKYELIAIDISDPKPSDLRNRILANFNKIIHGRNVPDAELKSLILNERIDILFDLNGDTSDSRWPILKTRLAPIQIGWLGYPAGMGPDVNDYIISDAITLPNELRDNFYEKVVHLPHTYIPNDALRQPMDIPTRTSQGLPSDKIILTCFNGQYKISETVFATWAKILNKYRDTVVLWVRDEGPYLRSSLKSKAEKYGVHEDQLIFSGRTHFQVDHLSRLQCADVALDTIPYNSHTTALDYIWAGVPLVTVTGECLTSRVASSILSACNLEDLVSRNLVDYEEKITRLIEDTELLKNTKDRVLAARANSPLFDNETFAQNFQRALYIIWENYVAEREYDHVSETQILNCGIDFKSPEHPQVNYSVELEKAYALLTKDEHKRAEDAFKKLVEINRNVKSLHGYSISIALQGRYKEALDLIDEAIKLEPNATDLLRHKEVIIEKNKNNIFELNATKLKHAKDVHKAGNYSEAIGLYEELLKLTPDLPAALHYMGVAMVQSGDISGIEYVERSCNLDPNNKNFEHNYLQLRESISSQVSKVQE